MSIKNAAILVFVFSIFAIIVYNKEINSFFLGAIVERAQHEESVGLGREIDHDLMFIDVNGNKRKAKSLLNGNHVVFVYSDNCLPCHKAVESIGLKELDNQIRSAFYILVFEDEIPINLKKFVGLNVYRSSHSRRDTIFDGLISPAFYVLKDGVLMEKKVGYHKNSINELQNALENLLIVK